MYTEVASFTDAWIETLVAAYLCVLICVASFTDAWIETGYAAIFGNKDKSHLLQMRGLKPQPAMLSG